jgi:phospholipid transport system substrate-binding protein
MSRISAAICGACWLAAASLVAPATWAQAPADAASKAADPTQMVQEVAQGLLQDLDANRDAYRKDPQKLKELVDKRLLPHFDIEYASRLVLGRHYRDATPEQRQKFLDAFENSMLQNYGNALVEFTANRLKVLPTHVDPNDKSTTVRTEIRRDDGSTVPVNYVVHMTDQGWKAWDVQVEGISYVKSFRDDFGAEIDQKGLDAVIARLQKGEKPAALPQPKKS